MCSKASALASDEICDERKELRGDKNRLLSLLKPDRGDEDEAMMLMLLMSSDSMVGHVVVVVVVVT